MKHLFWTRPKSFRERSISLNKKMFKIYVEDSIKLLTPKAQKLLEKEIPITIEKRCKSLPGQPNWGVLARCFGSAKGQPKMMPPKIELFQEDIEFANRFSNEGVMKLHIARIIAHELLHYLGGNENQADTFKDNLIEEFNVKLRDKSWWEKLIK